MKGWSCLITRGNNPPPFRPIALGPLGCVLPRAFWFVCSLLGLASRCFPLYAQPVPLEEVRESTHQAITVAPPRPTVQVGERLSFHGRWFGIPVGKGWIEVKARVAVNGHPAYYIEAQGHSNEFLSTFYPIHDEIRAYLDAKTLHPLRFEKVLREGHYRAAEIVTFDYERLVAHFESVLNGSTKEIPIPPGVHDIVSAFYWLRTHPVDITRPIVLDVYSDEKIYQTQITPLKTLWLELLWRGTFPCLMVEPSASLKGILIRRGRMWVYVSADEFRIPLLIKVATPWGPITGLIDPESLQAIRSPATHPP